MKRRHFIFSLTVFLFLPLATVTAGNRDSQWKQVEEAVAKGLPQTAIDLLKPIIEAALQERPTPKRSRRSGRESTRNLGSKGTGTNNESPVGRRRLSRPRPPSCR